MGASRQTTAGPSGRPAWRAEADRQAQALAREQRSAAVAQARALMADDGLSAADVAGKAPARGSKGDARHCSPAPGRMGL
jgi:hypothetical protein